VTTVAANVDRWRQRVNIELRWRRCKRKLSYEQRINRLHRHLAQLSATA